MSDQIDALLASNAELTHELRGLRIVIEGLAVALANHETPPEPKAPVPDQKLLTRLQAVDRCNVSIKSFDRWVRPKLTPIKVGRLVLFHPDDVAKFGNPAEVRAAADRVETSPRRNAPKPPARRLREVSPGASEIAARLRARAGRQPIGGSRG